jgi:hypothetical protein
MPPSSDRKKQPPPVSGGGCFCVSGHVAVYPRVDFAFPPAQVLADAVGGQIPFTPALADSAFRHAENRGYLTRRQQEI